MAGINFDTANTGYGGNYGGGGYYNGSNILDIAALGLVFGDGFGRRHDGYDKNCCPPATCKDVNDVDRDVLKCAFDTTEAVHDEGRRNQKDIWDTDKDVLLSNRDIKEELCHVQHKLEKDIWDVDKDLLLGFKEQDHRIDMVKCEMKEGFAEVKGAIKESALYQELREEKRYNAELARKLEKADDIILKKDIVSEILAAMGISPVIANSARV